MPANEQTLRNSPLLHRVFAISGIAMFVATIWVFWADQNRDGRVGAAIGCQRPSPSGTRALSTSRSGM